MIIEVSQNEISENGNIDDILAKEIESWKDFRYALREESALLFYKMLSECGQNKEQLSRKANPIQLIVNNIAN